ncbi:hypothetical protein BOX15_Mlig027233g2, partial [Macrostomum lignano]
VFEEFAHILSQKFPTLHIEGDNYPPPTWRQQLCSTLSVIKFAIIIAILSGLDPFPYLGVATPHVFTLAQENKLYACMMLFFVGNAIEGQLISTGAFEVSYNDMVIWSKLENGRVPSPSELINIIDSQLSMSSSSIPSS